MKEDDGTQEERKKERKNLLKASFFLFLGGKRKGSFGARFLFFLWIFFLVVCRFFKWNGAKTRELLFGGKSLLLLFNNEY